VHTIFKSLLCFWPSSLAANKASRKKKEVTLSIIVVDGDLSLSLSLSLSLREQHYCIVDLFSVFCGSRK
jgi:hypothetical protein